MSAFIELTPKVLETPEGAERIRNAVNRFQDKTAEVANLATQFVQRWRYQFLRPGDEEEGVDFDESLKELLDRIVEREFAQETLLQSLGTSPENREGVKCSVRLR